MKIFIVGDDLRTQILAKSLAGSHHRLTLISKDKEFGTLIANQTDHPVFVGDASQPEILEAAGADQCDLLIAMSCKDADNLVICELAKRRFGIPRTVATVENPANCAVFERLGVDSVVCTAVACTRLVEHLALGIA
jgi:trk system potassium uptake protein